MRNNHTPISRTLTVLSVALMFTTLISSGFVSAGNKGGRVTARGSYRSNTRKVEWPKERHIESSDWRKQPFPTDDYLFGVFAFDSSHVWACGSGGIWFFDGDSWKCQYPVSLGLYVGGIWGCDINHVWACGPEGKILFFDGSAWTTQFQAKKSYVSIDGLDQNTVWACGGTTYEEGDTTAKFDGHDWTESIIPFNYLKTISVHTPNDIWAAGWNDSVAHFDGSSWKRVKAPDTRPCYSGIDAIDSSHVWLSGDSQPGPFLYDGDSWQRFEVCSVTHWLSIRSTSPSDVWFVAYDAVYNYDGSSFAQVGSDFDSEVHDLSLGVDGCVWAVGNFGDVYELVEPSPNDVDPHPSKTWYFAEGATNAGFETWILVQNPNDQPAHIDLTYMTDTGKIYGPRATVPPKSRMTFNAADRVPGKWDVSTKVESDLKVAAERSVYWSGRTGGHNSVGATNPETDWCLAEGCTDGGFETWILVQNPNNTPTNVDILYLTPDGVFQGQGEMLLPNSRKSFSVADELPDEWQVSTVVSGNQPIVVERSMYWNGRAGGSNSVGTAYLSTDWMLPEGSTNGSFETWILLENPDTENAAQVNLTFMTDKGPVNGPSATLAPMTRQSFNVANYVPKTWSVSTKVSSDNYIVAERSMYWANRKGGHNSLGIIAPSSHWYVAEGCTKGGFETWVLVQNPNDSPVDVTLDYMTPYGPRPGPELTLGPNSRQTFFVADSVPEEWSVSTEVVATEPVVVEKSIYWSNRVEGGCSMGIAQFD